MKKLKKVAFVLIIVFVGIQFIPTTRNQSSEVLSTDFNRTFEVPQDIQKILRSSCYDCHSNYTFYPWYNKVQPVSWILENHIKEGKAELNFSAFGDYSKRRKKSKLKSIISQIKDKEMPPSYYTLMHGDAKLSSEKREQLIEWMDKLRDNL